MISIPYQAEAHRYAMLRMEDKDACADILCQQGGEKDIMPSMLQFGERCHRVYRIGGWVVEQYPSVLALFRIPGRENLYTQIDISFHYPVGMELELCDAENNVLRRESGLLVSGICLDDGIVLQTAQEDTAAMLGASEEEAELEQLRRQCREQEDELTRLQEENASLKEQNAGLLDERLDGPLEELLQRQEDLTQEIAGKRNRLEMLEAECETMRAQKEQLERQTLDAQGEIGKLRLSIEDLRRCVQEYEQHRVEALSRNQLVEIDAEATMNALSGSFEELLCTQDAAVLLEQTDVAESLTRAREIIDAAQKTLTEIIRVREELDRKIYQSLRRTAPKGEL